MNHVFTLTKLVPPIPPGLPAYFARIFFDPLSASPGRVIACTRCLNSWHCAPFVSGGEVERRRAEFEAKHRGCAC